MNTSLTVVAVLAVFLLATVGAEAHCDAVDGPVAMAASIPMRGAPGVAAATPSSWAAA